MNWVRAPVTLGVGLAAVLATSLLGRTAVASQPWLSWLVHTDLLHLLSDLVPWLVLGFWLEPRSGAARWAAWTGLGAALTGGVHGIAYPGQSAVYGLSAVTYAVAFAGLVAWRGNGVRSDPRRWAVFTLLCVFVLDEVSHGVSAWRSAIDELGRGMQFVPLAHVETTPLLHIAAAIVGVLLGLGAAVPCRMQSGTPPAGQGQADLAVCR